MILPDWIRSLAVPNEHDGRILENERRASSINVEGLAGTLYTQAVLENRAKILRTLIATSEFDKSSNHFLGPVEKLKVAISRGKRLRQLAVANSWSDEDYQIAADLIGEPDPYGLHASLFLVTLREQGTDQDFLDKAERWEYIGCYAQTELGHGSNVRGLETTATWDGVKQKFTIHTPNLTAAKWWIGSLGKVANHAVVMAQLVIDGKAFGPHAFMVQIRDLKSHEALPNVHIGDIGPKFGYNTMDTGFLMFDHLEIPHENMLSKFACVDKETSQYVRKGCPASVYSTMTYVRSAIVQRAGSALARGVTIAVRYCAVRRQFGSPSNPKGPELQVIDYSTVQMRVLPLLSTMFALHFAGTHMINLLQASRGTESSKVLADLHATSCGLKALASTLAAEGLETCRKACGGQGYSSFSGIGNWYLDYLPATTWEGDNYMITRQVGQHLLKSARSVLGGSLETDTTLDNLQDYLKHKDSHETLKMTDGDDQLKMAFAWRTADLTFTTLKKSENKDQSPNRLLIDFWRLSTAHSQYLILNYFYETLSDPQTAERCGAETFAILQKLFRLFAFSTIDNYAVEFLGTNAITIEHIQRIRDEIIPQLLEEIRPHSVNLVDAWKLSDWQLDSSIGRYDGKVYEDLFRRAVNNNPRNDVLFSPNL